MNIPSILDKTTEAQWEVFVQHSRRTDLQLRQKEIEASIHRENTGYGVRVILPRSDGAGVGFASCNSDKELEKTAKRAHDLAKLNRSPFFEIPEKQKLPATKTVDRKIVRDSEAVAREYAEAAQSLIAEEKEISLTFAKVRTYVVENQIVNSRRMSSKSTGTYAYLEMTFKVGTGANATEFWPTRYARRIDDIAPDDLITHWLTIARSSLKRRPPKTKNMTVIFSPSLVCDMLVPTIGFHASGEAKKLSLSQFKKGDKIASESLTVVDDGLYPYGLRTNPFDDEGQPQRRTMLIEKGVFKNYVFDQLYAQSMGAKPTGNGIRGGFRADVDERFQVPPEIATTNLSIKPGSESLDLLIHGVEEGLMIHHLAWLNPDEITTRFGAEIRNAQLITNGELGDGIVGGTVSGSVIDLIQRISGFSDRAEIISGYSFGCVAPYMKFDGVQISGPT